MPGRRGRPRPSWHSGASPSISYLFQTLFSFAIDPATARRCWFEGFAFPGLLSLGVMMLAVLGLKPFAASAAWPQPGNWSWHDIAVQVVLGLVGHLDLPRLGRLPPRQGRRAQGGARCSAGAGRLRPAVVRHLTGGDDRPTQERRSEMGQDDQVGQGATSDMTRAGKRLPAAARRGYRQGEAHLLERDRGAAAVIAFAVRSSMSLSGRRPGERDGAAAPAPEDAANACRQPVRGGLRRVPGRRSPPIAQPACDIDQAQRLFGQQPRPTAEVERLLVDCQKAGSTDYRVYMFLGVMARDAGNRERAIEFLKKAHDMAPAGAEPGARARLHSGGRACRAKRATSTRRS